MEFYEHRWSQHVNLNVSSNRQQMSSGARLFLERQRGNDNLSPREPQAVVYPDVWHFINVKNKTSSFYFYSSYYPRGFTLRKSQCLPLLANRLGTTAKKKKRSFFFSSGQQLSLQSCCCTQVSDQLSLLPSSCFFLVEAEGGKNSKL